MDLSNLSPANGARKIAQALRPRPGLWARQDRRVAVTRAAARAPAATPHRASRAVRCRLQRRLPKRGFHNLFRREYAVVNLVRLDAVFESGAVVDTAALVERGWCARAAGEDSRPRRADETADREGTRFQRVG